MYNQQVLGAGHVRALVDAGCRAALSLGGVAHKPWRRAAAEADLRGEAADRAAFAKAADILLRDAKGFSHNAFKVGLARRAVERALTQAANGTPQSQSSKKIR